MFGLLVLLGLLLGIRYFLRIRAQSAVAKPILKKSVGKPIAESIYTPVEAPNPGMQTSSPGMQTKIAQPGAKPAGKSVARQPAFKARTDMHEQTRAVPASLQKMSEPSTEVSENVREKSQEELAEADSIIEEAELYAIHGHPDRAVLILEELLQQHSAKTEAWLLLFSILSSLKKAADFEKFANKFIKINKDNAAWQEVQALGRTQDAANPLYADASVSGAARTGSQPILGRRALLGDILLAMGALSIQDMDRCLAEFDPKVDGRFGGYLIKRNMITEAQLDAALLQQQLNNEANTYQADTQPAANAEEPKKAMLPALELEPHEKELPKSE